MTFRPVPSPLRVLFVEDSGLDRLLTMRALKDLDIEIEVEVAINGLQAMRSLRSDKPLPHLMLLDIKMPLMNGWEVLELVKSDPVLRRVPVVILTTSNDDQDIFRSRDLHANGYVIKPVREQAFRDAIAGISGFWFGTNAIPDEPSH